MMSQCVRHNDKLGGEGMYKEKFINFVTRIRFRGLGTTIKINNLILCDLGPGSQLRKQTE